MSNAPAPADASDKLARTIFTLTVVGAIAFCGVVVVFVLN